MAKKIPEIPGGTIVLHQTGPNIDSWTEILRATSPRISIIYPDDARLDLDELWRELMNDRIPADSELFDWPNISQILFIVHMDFGGSLRSKPLISIHNITFFCIDDIAFSPKDFKDIPNPNNGPNTDDEDWEVEDYGIHHHYSPKQLSWRRRYQEILARVKSAETRVPVPPSQPKVIPCKNTHNLNGWISYFEELSPRIKIYRGGTSTCSESLKAFLAGVRKYYGIDDPEDQIINWPRDNEVAFTLAIDTALPDPKDSYTIHEFYVFLFNDCVFTDSNISGHEVGEGNDFEFVGWNITTYLPWKYVRQRLVIPRINELIKKVPNTQ